MKVHHYVKPVQVLGFRRWGVFRRWQNKDKLVQWFSERQLASAKAQQWSREEVMP